MAKTKKRTCECGDTLDAKGICAGRQPDPPHEFERLAGDRCLCCATGWHKNVIPHFEGTLTLHPRPWPEDTARPVSLTDDEIDFLLSALDSHEYWQLSESNERNDGASQIDDGENADVDFGRAIAHRLYQAKEGRVTLPAVRGPEIEPEEDEDEDDD